MINIEQDNIMIKNKIITIICYYFFIICKYLKRLNLDKTKF
jgi:hypothetical protein